jgi:CarboxypepD_reg-like domain
MPAAARSGLWLPACALALTVIAVAREARAQQGTAPGARSNAAPYTPPPDSSIVAIGDVVSAENGEPVPYATVSIEPGGHARFADAGGSFAIGHLTTRLYRLRVRQIGYAQTDTVIQFVSAGGPAVRLRVRLRRIALKLPTVSILARQECLVTGIPDSSVSPDLAGLFGELRKNIERYRLLIHEYPFTFAREEWRVSRNDGGYEETISLDTIAYDVAAMASRPYRPGSIVYMDVRRGSIKQIMYLPNFGDLGDSVFQRSHCFQYMGEDTTSGKPMIRVDFMPAVSIRTPDVEGSIYLDEARYVVERAEFRLTKSSKASPPVDVPRDRAVGAAVRRNALFRAGVPQQRRGDRRDRPPARVSVQAGGAGQQIANAGVGRERAVMYRGLRRSLPLTRSPGGCRPGAWPLEA